MIKKMTKKDLTEDVKSLLEESLQGYNSNYCWHYMDFYDGKKWLGRLSAYTYGQYEEPYYCPNRSDELDSFVEKILPSVTNVTENEGCSWEDDDDIDDIVIVDNIAPIEKIRRRAHDALEVAPSNIVLKEAIRLGVDIGGKDV